MNRTLALAGPVPADQNSKVGLTIVSDPDIAHKVPASHRRLFSGKRIYLTGRMTVMGIAGGTVACPFFLVEDQGNPLLVYFIPGKGDDWGCEEAAVVALVQSADQKGDLLFLSMFDSAKCSLTGCFRRIP
jgi:hypothetical protein